jgi:hypothetical protein
MIITNTKEKKINFNCKITPNSFNEIYKDIDEKIYFGNTKGINNNLICDLNDNSIEKIQFYITYKEGKFKNLKLLIYIIIIIFLYYISIRYFILFQNLQLIFCTIIKKEIACL